MTADYTFVNERLAKHYGIPNVYGSHFRRVTLTDDARRGLLGQGRDPDGDLARRPHVAGRARQVGARQPARRAAAAAARQRAAARRERGSRPGKRADDARADGGAPRATRCAPAATRSWIRSASRSRTSTPSAPWRDARRRHARHRRSTRRACCSTARKVDGVVDAAPGAAAATRRSSSAPSTEKLLTYALGRGARPHDMPDRARDRARRRARQLPVLVARRWASSAARRSRCGVTMAPESSRSADRTHAVSDGSADASERHDRRSRVMFITKRSLLPADDPPGHGRDARAAAARRDGAGADGTGADRGRTRCAGSARSSFRSASARASGTPATVGANFELTPILKPLEPFREPHDGGRRSCATRSTATPRRWRPG